MDVEGADGSAREDNQTFERKSALFALATSRALVVNMWENQVGLYNGGNMSLLRVILEEYLALFGEVDVRYVYPSSFLLNYKPSNTHTVTMNRLKSFSSFKPIVGRLL